MKITDEQVKDNLLEEEYWHERKLLFTAKLPSRYKEPQKIWGRFHKSYERFYSSFNLLELPEKEKAQVYISMHPFVYEPILSLTVGVYKQPKQYADMESPIGEVLGSKQNGVREIQIGSGQAWYYPNNKTIMLWECFFDTHFRNSAIKEDINMPNLWVSFEKWLLQQFPQATQLATPFNDPVALSIEDYQVFLKKMGYSPLVKGVFGKKIK